MIKTWSERCEEHPDHQTGMVSHTMIQRRMQEEIDDLRAALARHERKPLTDDQIDAIVRKNVTITDQNLSGAVYMSMREVEAAHGIGGDV